MFGETTTSLFVVFLSRFKNIVTIDIARHMEPFVLAIMGLFALVVLNLDHFRS